MNLNEQLCNTKCKNYYGYHPKTLYRNEDDPKPGEPIYTQDWTKNRTTTGYRTPTISASNHNNYTGHGYNAEIRYNHQTKNWTAHIEKHPERNKQPISHNQYQKMETEETYNVIWSDHYMTEQHAKKAAQLVLHKLFLGAPDERKTYHLSDTMLLHIIHAEQ